MHCKHKWRHHVVCLRTASVLGELSYLRPQIIYCCVHTEHSRNAISTILKGRNVALCR